MRIKELVNELSKLDQDAVIILFHNGEFRLPTVKEYNCNCGPMPKMYYIGPNEYDPNQKTQDKPFFI